MKLSKKVILPDGYKASGAASGIKKKGALDLALLYSQMPAQAAAVFTTNSIQAAPVKLSREQFRSRRCFQAIIVNSGNANCFTGKKGIEDAKRTAQYLAQSLEINQKLILTASTGIIGKSLPLSKIKKAIPGLVLGLSESGITKAAKAIMTTDKFSKAVTLQCNIDNRRITLCAIAKGAGMIAPRMATMLCFILTDANISAKALNKALKIAVDKSFNCITVDGCMSTNDTVVVLANGAKGNAQILPAKDAFNTFSGALNAVCLELAKMIVRDGEGATKLIEIKVTKAKSVAEARQAGLAIANSNLFKAAMYGEDANFGRVVASLGASGIGIQEKDLKIKMSSLGKKEILVEASLSRGKSESVVYTSDLTPEYIKINAHYS